MWYTEDILSILNKIMSSMDPEITARILYVPEADLVSYFKPIIPPYELQMSNIDMIKHRLDELSAIIGLLMLNN